MIQPWFSQAKLGIFIHYGIYAVDGIPESWSFFSGRVSYEEYMAQCAGFTAAHYDPQAWADLFQRAGARYAVLTTKHHDGVALWETQLSDLNVVKKTPAGRDLVTPYVEALRARGIKVGLYFSQLDWSHPDYAPIPVGTRTGETLSASYQQWTPDTPQWLRYLDFHRGQLRELCTQFGKVDLLWFDGDWDPGDDRFWRMKELRDLLHSWQPEVILNSRMRGYGDYATPEQGIPIAQPHGPWEFCMTINDSWGFQPQDTNYKSLRQIVRTFAEVIGMGGNLLLDIGPRQDGSIPEEQVERLEGLGDWIRQHEEAVYDTGAGLPAGHFYGASTLSNDRTTLYLMLFDRPWDEIAVKGIRNAIKRVTVLGSGTELAARKLGGADWVNIPGVLWIQVPEAELDANATVIKVELDGPLDLYSGAGQAIESN